MYRIASAGLAALALALLSACGGGGGGSTLGPVPNAKLGGLWTGTLTVSGVSYDMTGLSAENGTLELIESDTGNTFAAQYWGAISSTGSNFTASFTGAVISSSGTFSDGSLRGTGTATGTIVEHASINGTVTFTTSLNTVVTGTLALTNDPTYSQPSSLAAISGNYTNAVTAGDTLSITTGGVITYADPAGTQCVGNGTVSIIDASYAVYGGQISFSGCSNALLNGTSFQGIGAIDSVNVPPLMLFLMHGTVSSTDVPLTLLYQKT